MITSMTGFGREEYLSNDIRVVVEARSLNSKQADIKFKLPAAFRDKELEVKKLIQDWLVRGKIDVNIEVYKNQMTAPVLIDHQLAKAYDLMLRDLENELMSNFESRVSQIMRMPEILKNPEEISDKITPWEEVQKTLIKALEKLNDFRKEEGAQLHADIHSRLLILKQLKVEIAQFAPERKAEVISRLKKGLEDIGMEEKANADRFEQELVFYIEKYDITEELVRLESHCNYFIEVMQNETQQGRKLGFISQEIGREVNTIGSKANHAGIQKLVVLMKDEVEKIKEQLLNVL